jgi:rhodanese-related sulfurtransferase
MAVPSISVEELAAQRSGNPLLVLLDVRDDDEWQDGHVDFAVHIPLDQLQARIGELDPNAPIALMCHHGGRSSRGTAFLLANGFEKAVNVDGGIDAYAERVDPSIPRY